MKIALLCGSIEPGQDGVGDYSRFLSVQLMKIGIECTVIALNDRRLQNQLIDRGSIEPGIASVRMSSKLTWPDRIRELRNLLDAFNPDWISLQYVPYSYDDRGIPDGLAGMLAPVFQGRQLQIMFHEMWLDWEKPSFKIRLTAVLQKRCIRKMLRQLSPAVVHTSNASYCRRLKSIGIDAKILPLFGNIPIASGPADPWLQPILTSSGIQSAGDDRKRFWFIGFFGTLHRAWPPEPLLSRLLQSAREQEKRLVLLSAGSIGEGAELWQELEKRYAGEIEFVLLGRQSEERASQFLCALDAGIATSPCLLVGKSGSATAMLEHGLTVIVNRELEYAGCNESLPEGAVTLDMLTEERLRQGFEHRDPEWRLPAVASQLVGELGEARH